jgi:tetratricopeptide (TPR) repeat protein
MDCRTIRERQVADEYRAGRLTPEEAEAYERHYFECDRCFEDLRLRDRLADALRAEGKGILAPDAGSREKREARWRPPRPVWAGAFALAAAAVAVLIVVGRPGFDTARLRGLVTPEPYPYGEAALRAGPASEAFRQGMDLYASGRYPEAAERLAACMKADPANADAWFYRGVCLLLSRDAKRAAVDLAEAVRRAPSSDAYRWYLAQALLMQGRVGEAERELGRLASGGEMAARARALLERIASVKSGSPGSGPP